MDTGEPATRGPGAKGKGLVRLRAVIFDFDFTLVDSSRGFVECYHYAAERLSLPAPPDLTAMAMMGTPLPDAFRQLFPEENDALGRDFVRLWQEKADEVMTGLTATYAQTLPATSALREQGLGLGIVSQKLRRRIEAVLERDGLSDYFGVVIGGEDISAFKPHPEGLLKAAAGLGAGVSESIYVGDTVIDAQAAANAGMAFVAVTSGVTPAADFEAYQRIALLPDVGGLPDLCRSLSS